MHHEHFVADDEKRTNSNQFWGSKLIRNLYSKKTGQTFPAYSSSLKIEKRRNWNSHQKKRHCDQRLFWKLKEKYSEKDNSIKKQNSVECRKIHQKFIHQLIKVNKEMMAHVWYALSPPNANNILSAECICYPKYLEKLPIKLLNYWCLFWNQPIVLFSAH